MDNTAELNRIKAQTQFRTRLEGRNAYAEKIPISCCPYFHPTNKSTWWREGWVEAMRQDVKSMSDAELFATVAANSENKNKLVVQLRKNVGPLLFAICFIMLLLSIFL